MITIPAGARILLALAAGILRDPGFVLQARARVP
jgi:hypothetical protein